MKKRYREVSEITVKEVLEHTPIGYQKVMFNSEVIMDWYDDPSDDRYGDVKFDETEEYLGMAVTSWHVFVDCFHHGTVYLTGYRMGRREKKQQEWLDKQDREIEEKLGLERPRGFRELPEK